MKNRLALLIATIFLAAPHLATAIISDQANAEDSQKELQSHVTRKMKATAFPYWSNVGQIGRSTGVYLGNGYVLTAAHVGAGDFILNGQAYRVASNSIQSFRNRDGSTADFTLFKVEFRASDPIAKLPEIQLATIPPQIGAEVLLLGAGAGGSTDRTKGGSFPWSDQHHLRWGVNQIEEIYSAPLPTHEFLSYGYATKFERGGIECQAAPGDSGGACFRYNAQAKRWELAGIIVAVDSEFGRAEYGNQTYIADPVLFKGQLAVAFGKKSGRNALIATAR